MYISISSKLMKPITLTIFLCEYHTKMHQLSLVFYSGVSFHGEDSNFFLRSHHNFNFFFFRAQQQQQINHDTKLQNFFEKSVGLYYKWQFFVSFHPKIKKNGCRKIRTLYMKTNYKYTVITLLNLIIIQFT